MTSFLGLLPLVLRAGVAQDGVEGNRKVLVLGIGVFGATGENILLALALLSVVYSRRIRDQGYEITARDDHVGLNCWCLFSHMSTMGYYYTAGGIANLNMSGQMCLRFHAKWNIVQQRQAI